MAKQTPVEKVLFPRSLRKACVGLFALALIFSAIFGNLLPNKASAATNSTVNFQARLEGTGGNVAPDGLYNIEFKIYTSPTVNGNPDAGACTHDGGTAEPTCLWYERYYDANGVTAGQDNRVTVTNGYVSVQLGSQTAFPGTIPWDQVLYVTMNVGGTTQTATPTFDGEMTPRLQLTGVPYAFRAGTVATFGGTYTSTLNLLSPTVGDQAFQVKDQAAAGTYTICVQGATAANGGCAASTGAAGYVQNQNASAQSTSNFWISGTGRADTNLIAPLLQTADTTSTAALAIRSGNASSGNSGNVTIDVGTATGTAGSISIGAANATAINLGQNVTVAANKSIIMTGGTSFPGSPVEGQIFYRSDTNQTYLWDGARWQADRSSATLIVAASDSLNKEKADYVADGTGDQTEINAAIQALPSQGGTVVLLDGNYSISGTIDVDSSSIRVVGQGQATNLNKAWNQTSAGTGIFTINGDKAYIGDMRLVGNKATYTNANNDGIYKSNAYERTTINNVIVYDFKGDGILLNGDGGNTSMYHHLTNNWITGNDGNGIELDHAIQSAVVGNNVDNNAAIGLYLESFANSTVSNNAVDSNNAGIQLNGSNEDVISGNSVNGNTTYGIRIHYSTITVTGNLIDSNADGIEVRDGTSLSTISSNIITSSTDDGIVFDSGSATSEITVNDNNIGYNDGNGIELTSTVSASQISDNRLTGNGGGGSSSAIYVNTADDINLTGNKISDTAGSGYAIEIASGGNNNYLSDNTYSGTGAASIGDSGTGTVYSNQVDSNGNLINKSIGGGFAVGGTSANSSLSLQGALKTAQLSAPTLSATVTNVGTPGSTTHRYVVTALDGIGETTGSSTQQTATGNATLSGSNYNTITWTPVGGAYQYRIYRCTGAACTPLLLATVAGNTSSYNDQANGSPSGAIPGTNTTGGGSFAAALQGTTATFAAANALTLGTASSVTGGIVFKGSGGAGTLTLQGPATPNASNYTLSMPAITGNATICTDNTVCTGYAGATGAAGYIQNQNASAQSTSNYWISGSGRADTSYISPLMQSADTNASSTNSAALVVRSGNAAGSTSNSGDVTIDVGTATQTKGTLNVGTSNAVNINIGTNAAAHTIAIGNGAAVNGVTVGSTNSTSTAAINGGTGATAVAISAGSGGTIAVGSSGVANTINLGNTGAAGSVAQTVNIATNSSAGGTNTVTIGNTAATASTVNIQGGTGASAVVIQAGTSGTITVGSSSVANSITVGNAVGASAVNLLAGTGNVTVGTADATSTQLVLDSGTSDPTGAAGGMYYNTASGKFRCYQAAAWADCITSTITATANSQASFVAGLANAAANTAGQVTETMVFTSATAVSTTAGVTGFTAPANGSFRSCLVKNNANITAGTLSVRWRVNGASVGSSACNMDSTAANRRQATTALDSGVVTFVAGDTIGIAIDTDAAYLPTTDDYTVYWSVEYNASSGNGLSLQFVYDSSSSPAGIALSNGKDLVVTAADTATDPNFLVNLQCATACGSNGRFAIQNAGADVLAISPNSGGIQIGNTTGAVTQTINIGTNSTGSSSTTTNIGSSIAGTVAVTGPHTVTNRTSGSSDTFNVSNSTSTGTIANFQDNSTTVFSLADGGAATFENQTNSAAAFQIQSSAGTNNINVNTLTTNNNLWTNPSFEQNINGVVAHNTGVVTHDGTGVTAQYGASTLKLVTGATNNNGAEFRFPFKGSTTYNISMWMRVDSGGPFTNINIGYAENGSDTDCATSVSVSTTWAKYTCTASFTTGTTIGATSNFYVKVNSATSRTIYIDGVSLVAASTALDYSLPGNALQVEPYANQVIFNAGNNAEIQPWQLNPNPLTAARSRPAVTTANGYIYSAGGGTGTNGATPQTTVYYAKVNADGTIGSWNTTNTLGTAVSGAGATVSNGYIYVIGGSTGADSALVQYARLNADGTTGTWGTTTALTQARDLPGVTAYAGYIQIYGGNSGASSLGSTLYAKVNTDGTISSWTTGTSFASANTKEAFQAVVSNGYVYLAGGTTTNETAYTTTVDYAPLNSDGSIGTWVAGTVLPNSRGRVSSVAMNGNVYVFGGYDGTNAQTSVYYAPILGNGALGSWVTSGYPLPIANATAARAGLLNAKAVTISGYAYLVGGDNTNAAVSTVYYTSGARVKINGALDLTSANGTNSEPGTGGQLTAGNTNVIGSLQVADSANFLRAVSVTGALQVGGDTTLRSTTNSTTALQIQNSTGSTLFSADTTNGALIVGKRTDSGGATTDWSNASGAAGTPCASGQASVDSTRSSVVYNGSLYIGTSEADKAEVCRYDGGTTLTRVVSAAGTFGANANTDTVTAMAVYNGYLYIATTGGAAGAGADTNVASIYRYDSGTTWTLINTTQGQLDSGGTTGIDSIPAMAVYQGALYVGTSEGAVAQVHRYNSLNTGASVFTRINTTAGTFGATAAVASVNSMAVFDGKLYIGTTKANAGEVLSYSGAAPGAAVFTAINTTAGTFDTTASVDTANTLAVCNGQLYVGTSESNASQVLAMSGAAAAGFTRLNTTSGTFVATASIDAVASMACYNGTLFIGTSEGTSAEVYYANVGNNNSWTKVSQAAGTIKASGTASIVSVPTMIAYNDYLYAGTNKSNSTELLAFTRVNSQSYALKFIASNDQVATEQSGNPNFASIYFAAEQGSNNGSPQIQGTGSFVFSNGISTAGGGYDVAEDYPTRDDSLRPGDLVSIDPNETGFVRKASGPYDPGLVGVYSEKPALRLTQKDTTINGGRAIPVALAGRVPVRVTGDIMPGDPLTSSDIPGVAMKAAGVGRIVGMAMGPHSGTEDGIVTAFINPNYYSGSNELQSSAGMSEAVSYGTLTTKDLVVTGQAAVETLTVTASATIGSLRVIGLVTTQQLTVTGLASVQQIELLDRLTLGSGSEDPTASDTAHPITKRFKASKDLLAGTIVVADGRAGWVTTTATPGDTRVVGVAIAAVHRGELVEVAIGGTAKALVSGGAGIGQLLTTAQDEGKTSVTDQPASGAVLGKVLGAIDSNGRVLVLVTLQ